MHAGWNREESSPILKEVVETIPGDLQKAVYMTIHTMAHRSTQFSITVKTARLTKEIAQRWREHLEVMIMTGCEGKGIRAWLQKKPSREARDTVFAKLKRLVKHEFGDEKVNVEVYPKI